MFVFCGIETIELWQFPLTKKVLLKMCQIQYNLIIILLLLNTKLKSRFTFRCLFTLKFVHLAWYKQRTSIVLENQPPCGHLPDIVCEIISVCIIQRY